MTKLVLDDNSKSLVVDVAYAPDTYTVDDVVQVLEFTSDQYHNNSADEGESFLTDAQWDVLYRYLQRTDPVNKYLIGVGASVRGDKVALPHVMPGLDQVHEGDTEKWIASIGIGDELIVVMDKMDGNSGQIIYDTGGNLQSAFSRGSSTEGQDLTRHLKRIKSCPQTGVGVDINGSMAIRVEIEMKEEVFERLNAQGVLRSRSGKKARNARNYIAGQLNSSEAEQVFYDNVDVIAYEIMFPFIDTKNEEFNLLESYGFDITENLLYHAKNLNDSILIAHLEERHKVTPWAIDGLVMVPNDRSVRDAIPDRKGSSLNPVYAKKFKVGQEDNFAIAEVVAIHRKVSKHGYLKPRVEINPVDLVGVTVTYATAFNELFLKKNNLGVGAKVKITRAGDVIPFLVEVVEPGPIGYTPPDISEFGAYAWSEPNSDGESVDLILLDADNSDDAKLQKLVGFFTNLGVEFIAIQSLTKLFEAGYETPEDIINESYSNIQKIIGDANGKKGMDSLAAKLNSVEPWMLAGVTNYFGRGVGRRKMKRVFEATGKITGNTVSELVAVEGIEEKTAQKIVDGSADYDTFLGRIAGKYSFAATKVIAAGGAFEGAVVVFTGFRDADAQAAIEAMGGRVGSSVSAKTTLVVTKDPTSTTRKIREARDLGIEIIDPAALNARLV
jgi:DNA ligase (NAD+)